MGLANVACRPEPTLEAAAAMDVHGEKWTNLVGDSLQASVLIEPVRRDENFVLQVVLCHGLTLSDPAAHFEPDEIRARAIIGGEVIHARSVLMIGNIDECTELELSFDVATIAGGDRSAPFELLLEVRDAVSLVRWERD